MSRKRLALVSLVPLLASTVLCLAYLSPRNLAADAAPKKAGNTKWEYKVVTAKSASDLLTDKEKDKIGLEEVVKGHGLEIVLNKLGADGWELALEDSALVKIFADEPTFIFKRPR